MHEALTNLDAFHLGELEPEVDVKNEDAFSTRTQRKESLHMTKK